MTSRPAESAAAEDTSAADPFAYYVPVGDGAYRPTRHVQGAWRDDEQHMAPVGGILAHEIETHEPRPELQMSRVTYEILGMIPDGPSHIDVRTLRPGRTIELVEATMTIGDRPVVRATAWRLSRQDTAAVAGGFWEPLPDPAGLERWDATTFWGGGFIASLDIRPVPGGRPGRRAAWIRTDVPLVSDGTATPTAAFLGLIDTANGIATRESPREWMFPNTDLTVHLFRQPQGEWVGFDTEVIFGPEGVGLTSSHLFDEAGAVGRAEQILTVRPLPGA